MISYGYYLVQKNYRRYTADFLLVNSFILTVLVSTISNYEPYTYIIKSGISVLLLSVVFYHAAYNNVSLIETYKDINKTALFLYTVFIVYAGISILYSANSTFGMAKWIQTIIGHIPAMAAFCYIVVHYNDRIFRSALYSVTALTILGGIVVLFTSPFDYPSVPPYTITNWSHVIYGRFLIIPLILYLFLFITETNKYRSSVYLLLLLFTSVTTYYTGFRAGTFGFLVIIFLLFLYFIFGKEKIKVKYLLILFIPVLFFILYSFDDTAIQYRYAPLLSTDEQSLGTDGGIASRFETYSISIHYFIANPIFGVGYGGFNTFYESDLPTIMKYPHNIFLEFMAELGTIGLLLCLSFLVIIFRNAYGISPFVLFYFIFSFWLALFSKDIASNTMLFIGLMLPAGVYRKKKMHRAHS